MVKILIAGCEQEISSFNPVPSQYEDFEIHRGPDLIAANAGAETCIRGALDVFCARRDIEVIPTYGARACSAGPLSRAGFDRLAGELLAAIRERAQGVGALYFCLHGAMGAEHELDPEGYLLEEARKILGPERPIVISLDLHGMLTERMLRHCNGLAVYHTYPHEDFVETGQRAARLLLRILDEGVRPVVARVVVPALVRGPELMTKTGVFGEIIRTARQLERQDKVLAAAMMIGNPFTDAPELCSQAVVVTDNDPALAGENALGLAGDFWAHRHGMQARLIPLAGAIAEAKALTGPVTFSDAADAPSSGASGDSSAILAGLIQHGYQGKVLMPIVDAPAVQQAFAAGVGQTIPVNLGGSLDRRFMDRSLFLAHGQDPQRFDLIVVKSPGAYARYFTWATKNYNVDVPGATSANLQSLPYQHCRRPMFPLDPDASFAPKVELFGL